MDKFKKMVAIEPTRLLPEWDERLKEYAEDSVFYSDIPPSNEEIIKRIDGADCVLLSYTSQIDSRVLEACPGIRYIGMCCSLYSPESANVDILRARDLGMTVTGVRDYGDLGVREYVVSQLVRLLQGHGGPMWRDEPMELTGLNIGILGMGAVGGLVTGVLHFFGANLCYYSRTPKPDVEAQYNCTFLPLDELLQRVDILVTCLNKNVVLLGQRELDLFGSGKILFNTSISPSHDVPALVRWLKNPRNFALSDTVAGLGREAADMPNALCGTHNAGLTYAAKQRLGQKVAENIRGFLANN